MGGIILVKVVSNSILLAMLFVNLGGLTMMLFKPAGNGAINLIHYISKKYGNTELLTIYCLENNNPYIIGNAKGLKANFYIPDNLILKDITLDFITDPEPNQIVIIPKGYITERHILEEHHYKTEKSGIPTWVMEMNKFYRVFNENSVPLLYTQKDDDHETD